LSSTKKIEISYKIKCYLLLEKILNKIIYFPTLHCRRREIKILLSNFTSIKENHQDLGKLTLKPTYIDTCIFLYR